jgi:hypothetical protein
MLRATHLSSSLQKARQAKETDHPMEVLLVGRHIGCHHLSPSLLYRELL